MDRLKLVLAGVGFWGRQWLRELKLREAEIDLCGIVSVDRAQLEEVGDEFGIPEERRFHSSHDAIRHGDAEAIIVAVPPDQHLEVVAQAIEASMHILVEKPLAATFREALEIGQMLESKPRLVFMVDQTRRWRSHIQTAKRQVEAGLIGQIGQVLVTHIQAVRMEGYRARLPDVVIDDMAIHNFDIVRLLTGTDPVEIYAHSHNPRWSWYETRPSSAVLFSMTEGVEGCYFGSWVGRGKLTSWEGDITLIGAKGTLEILGEKDLFFHPVQVGEELAMLWEGKQRERIPIEPLEREEIAFGLQEFSRCIRSGLRPETYYEDNIKSFAMVCMAQQSLRTHAPFRYDSLLTT